jgi:hypothetical protein
MKPYAAWLVSIVLIGGMGAAQATAAEAKGQGAATVSHQTQGATANRSAAVVQAPESDDAADAAVSPGAYALVLLGLGALALATRRGAATPKFADKQGATPPAR